MLGVPLHWYRYKEDGSKEKALAHPFYHLLHDEPNQEMSSFVFRETLTTRLLRWDNANAQIIRNGKSEVITLNTLMPSRMAMDRDTKGWFHYKQYSSSARMPQRWRVSSSTCLSSDMPQIPGFSLSLLSSKCVVFADVPRDFQRLAEYFSYGWRRKGPINRSCPLKIGAEVRTVR